MTAGLRRQLGFAAITAILISEVIAVGIFLTPAGMARSIGSPMWLLIVWVAMGGMALCGALCYGELASRLPEAGGGYVYLREAYGPRVAFLYGWKSLLVMDPGITAALAVGLASYAGYLFELGGTGETAVAIGSIALLAGVNIVGVGIGARFIGAITFLKLAAIAVIATVPFVLGLGDSANFLPFVEQRPGSDPLLEALAAGFVGGFFAFGGWWEVSKLAGEARDPARTVPRALAAGVAIVTLTYILTTAAFLYLVPLEQVGSGETFAAQAGEAMFGQAGGQIFAAIVIVSVVGSLAVLIMALPRVYWAMARDGLFFRRMGELHPRFGTPARAIALQSALASVLVLLGTFDQILGYFIFVTVVFLGLTVAAVYVLRRRGPAPEGVFRTPGYPVTPAVFLVLALILLVLLGGRNPREALLGVGVVLLGLPAYAFLFRDAGVAGGTGPGRQSPSSPDRP